MSDRGLTVGWASRLAGAPPLPQALVSDHSPDVAWPASAVEGPAFRADVPVLDVDGLEFAADGAGLPPLAVSEFATGVDALVLELRDDLEVPDVVVELVAVSVVDVVPRGDVASVVLLPDVDVFHDLSPADSEPAVSLGCDCPVHGFIVSQLHEGRNATGRSPFGALAT